MNGAGPTATSRKLQAASDERQAASFKRLKKDTMI